MTPNDLVTSLRPLLAAECAAEAPAAGIDAADLEQAVWVRLLSDRHDGAPAGRRKGRRRAEPPALRLRAAVRAEARAASRLARREVPYDPIAAEPADRADAPGSGVERAVLAAESRRELRAAVRRLPGRCPGLMRALLSSGDPTYREIAGELGISQGSLGPIRSRCLGCLRRMLTAAIAAPGPWGRER
ncbi:sigma-70 family RNA polymerase sigma factor [Streptomyces mobaraensis NBRC 13819 = DSM 40847]|uniref:Sigma-70 family RNA polymerase sigma factor n=2 Tax=Streptomyces mobaraensis TaxID=35621 RepID=A0A5N5VXS4_STRMB|nr:sigma-70 family RNA polymerase sigma factor [Streptomyces mobaraensis]EME96449.1 RNA polymerase sigma factor [Streptomyces mobaraensis NBRC 13819 = DSM 40847]KAB7833612.1 sigma-70 family RNA polymerase sigma factor [Streptomyces mobaraensis]QTT72927.1 sigma-70 family RNA polymerase sigma factor [Streptomyces mobaraensis NBRC 13819 = DSM 40847]